MSQPMAEMDYQMLCLLYQLKKVQSSLRSSSKQYTSRNTSQKAGRQQKQSCFTKKETLQIQQTGGQ